MVFKSIQQNEIDNDLSTIVKFHMDCQNKGSEMRNNLATRPLNDQLKEEASLSYIPLAYYSFSTIYLCIIFLHRNARTSITAEQAYARTKACRTGIPA